MQEDGQASYPSLVPEHFPPIEWDGPEPSPEQIELGRWLFYDQRLSRDGTRSCGICHEQQKAFTDGLVRGIGLQGASLPFNSLSLANVAWRSELTWSSRISDIETHMLVPLLGEDPPEMGMDPELVEERLGECGYCQEMFGAAFPHDESPASMQNAVSSIAAFTRTIVSGGSAYDGWLLGDESLGAAALRGMELFHSDRTNCSACHGGLFFDRPFQEQTGVDARHGYFNTGLYNVDGEGGYPPGSPGLIEATGQPDDMGRFRVPSLRNLSYTYPWMHDGTELSLESIIDSYARGGRLLESGPYPGDGAQNPYKSELVAGFVLSPSEKEDLLAFLDSLNDPGLAVSPSLGSPFCSGDAESVPGQPCEPRFQLD